MRDFHLKSSLCITIMSVVKGMPSIMILRTTINEQYRAQYTCQATCQLYYSRVNSSDLNSVVAQFDKLDNLYLTCTSDFNTLWSSNGLLDIYHHLRQTILIQFPIKIPSWSEKVDENGNSGVHAYKYNVRIFIEILVICMNTYMCSIVLLALEVFIALFCGGLVPTSVVAPWVCQSLRSSAGCVYVVSRGDGPCCLVIRATGWLCVIKGWDLFNFTRAVVLQVGCR